MFFQDRNFLINWYKQNYLVKKNVFIDEPDKSAVEILSCRDTTHYSAGITLM